MLFYNALPWCYDDPDTAEQLIKILLEEIQWGIHLQVDHAVFLLDGQKVVTYKYQCSLYVHCNGLSLCMEKGGQSSTSIRLLLSTA